jgi:hypothetical protein
MQAEPSSALNMLQEISTKLDHIENRVKPADKKAYLQDLPHLQLKSCYTLHPGPPAKGEGNCSRASWPQELKKDCVPMPQFFAWLKIEMNKKKTNLTRPYQCLGRFMGMLEAGPGAQPSSFPSVHDTKYWVAVYVHGLHKTLMEIALMHPKYDWAMETLEGLHRYCDYHISLINYAIIKGDDGYWVQYKNCMEQMKKDLRSGHWKRCHDMLEVNHAKKEKQDRLKLRKFPLQEHRKAAVTNSCLIMKCIAKAYADQAAMPLRYWGLCNSGAAGCIYNTTHGGRCKEWVIADLQYVRVLLAERKECMECTEHKTWKTYGDLAKWLSPTLIDYLLCYDSCPRPEGHSTFFVPAKAGAAHMSMQSALRTWCKRHIADGYTKPTVNDYRKHSHKALIDLTKTEEKLKKVLVIIDAHSKKTMEGHYLLKEPEQDAKLGKMLAGVVHGTSPAWPSDQDLERAMAKDDTLGRLLQAIIQGKECEGEAEEEEEEDEEADGEGDEEEMVWWQYGDIFRIPQQLPALPAPEQHMPLEGQAETPTYDYQLVAAPAAAAASPHSSIAAANTEADVITPAEALGLAASEDTGSQRRAAKKPRNSPVDMTKYQAYFEPREPGQPRCRSTPEAKLWMKNTWLAWQEQNNCAGSLQLPDDTEWYYDVRMVGVDMGHIRKDSDKSIVRSYLLGLVKKMVATMALDVD